MTIVNFVKKEMKQIENKDVIRLGMIGKDR